MNNIWMHQNNSSLEISRCALFFSGHKTRFVGVGKVKKISRLVACSPGFCGSFAPALLFVEGH